MAHRRHEFKKHIVEDQMEFTINSNGKRSLLKVPNIAEILMTEEYVSMLKLNEKHTDSLTEPQCDTKKAKLCEEKENVPTTSTSAKNKDNSKNDIDFKIPGKVKKESRKQKEPQVETPTEPIVFHSIFDSNLLRSNGRRFGCECTARTGFKYANPFFKDLLQKLPSKEFTVKCAVIEKNGISKVHIVTVRPLQELYHIINTMRPTLYVSEDVFGSEAAIGVTYSLIIKLVKDNICVEKFSVKHTFTQAEKKFLDMSMYNYLDFDTIYYYHNITSSTPGVKLDLEKVMSIKIGRSALMFLSNSIQWTDPDGPKVIVERADQPSDHLFY